MDVLRSCLVALALCLLACSGEPGPARDAGMDGADAGATAADAGDSGVDVGDAGPDGGEASTDGGLTPSDAGTDAGTDAGVQEPFCGDGTCDEGETDANCGGDCGCGALETRTEVAPAGCVCDDRCSGQADCCADACSAFGTCYGAVSHSGMNIYTHWWMAAGELTNFEAPLRIEVDPSGQSFFWAATFWMGTEGGYIGLQTRGENNGKVARISIWNSLAATAPAGGTGACRDFDGEGVGKTCWQPFAWHAGETYRLRVEQLTPGWWRGSVVTDSTGATLVIGDIQGPPGGSLLHRNISNFTEYYGAFLPSCDALNAAEVTFESPRTINGVIYSARSSSSVGTNACPGLFTEAELPQSRALHRVH